MEGQRESVSLQRLLDEPKGKTTYLPNQAFLLHVFWEAPSTAAAEKVLEALRRCAAATHRDTPCVPTYYFRVSSLDADLASPAPTTVAQHKQLREAQRKLKVGVPRPAILADLMRRGIDPQLLDAAPEIPLPTALQQAPVMLECTELYLDQRAFYEHAGSRDYLRAYGEVMEPGLQNGQTTIRLGTPTSEIVDKILAPMLKESVEPVLEGCVLWKRPESNVDQPVLMSMNVQGTADDISQKLPAGLREASTTCIAFAHPLRRGWVRVMCILAELPSLHMLEQVADLALGPVGGFEIYCDEDVQIELARRVRLAIPNGHCTVNTKQAGYLLHEKVCDLRLSIKIKDPTSTKILTGQ